MQCFSYRQLHLEEGIRLGVLSGSLTALILCGSVKDGPAASLGRRCEGKDMLVRDVYRYGCVLQ